MLYIGLIVYFSGVIANVSFSKRRKNYLTFQYGKSGYNSNLIITSILSWIGYGFNVYGHNIYKKDFPGMK